MLSTFNPRLLLLMNLTIVFACLRLPKVLSQLFILDGRLSDDDFCSGSATAARPLLHEFHELTILKIC